VVNSRAQSKSRHAINRMIRLSLALTFAMHSARVILSMGVESLLIHKWPLWAIAYLATRDGKETLRTCVLVDSRNIREHVFRQIGAPLVRNMSAIDKLDAEIISLLQSDGRRPSVEMARLLKVAEGTIRKRIERLIGEEVIQISAWADPLRIGYQNYAVLMMSVDLQELDRAAEQIAELPEIFFLGTCTGAFDLFVTACFHSLQHMHEFITQRLSQVAGIRRISTSHVMRVVKRDYSFDITPTDEAKPDRTVRARYKAAPRAGKRSKGAARAAVSRKQ
jgi:Lrp/AsnC family transcriptional regulator, regulator for asnA, asnC and gidA